MTTTPCKGCGKPIVWGTDAKGRKIALDPAVPVFQGLLGCALPAHGAMIFHFSVCEERDADLAWAAGVFEGEGTITIGPHTKRNLGVLICSIRDAGGRMGRADLADEYAGQGAHRRPRAAARGGRRGRGHGG